MRPSARKNIQREIERSEAPCSEANNQRTTDAGAQSMSLAHYIEGGKLARERVGAENAKNESYGGHTVENYTIWILQTVGRRPRWSCYACTFAPESEVPRTIRIEKRYPPSSGSCRSEERRVGKECRSRWRRDD